MVHEHTSSCPKGPCHAIQRGMLVLSCSKQLHTPLKDIGTLRWATWPSLLMLRRLFTSCVMLKNEKTGVHEHTSSCPKGPCHAIQRGTLVLSCSKSLPYTPQQHWNTTLGNVAVTSDGHLVCRYVCVCVYVYVCMYVCVCVCVRMYVRMHACMEKERFCVCRRARCVREPYVYVT